MNEEIIVIEEELSESTTAVSPAETSRRLALAGIGIFVVFRGELASLINRFIEQGEMATSENSPPALRTSKTRRAALKQQIKSPMSKLLRELNIPTKSDIDSLNDQVNDLINKIETLQQLSAPGTLPELEIPAETEEDNK